MLEVWWFVIKKELLRLQQLSSKWRQIALKLRNSFPQWRKTAETAQEIRQLLQETRVTDLVHIGKDANQVTNCLANYALSMNVSTMKIGVDFPCAGHVMVCDLPPCNVD
uniref:Uncharacterized protein n=1 Tax=Cannabis sativa TaxID=3483 RepID=A0A803Q9Q6_CANSA